MNICNSLKTEDFVVIIHAENLRHSRETLFQQKYSYYNYLIMNYCDWQIFKVCFFEKIRIVS